jgi:hypothetical protein
VFGDIVRGSQIGGIEDVANFEISADFLDEGILNIRVVMEVEIDDPRARDVQQIAVIHVEIVG